MRLGNFKQLVQHHVSPDCQAHLPDSEALDSHIARERRVPNEGHFFRGSMEAFWPLQTTVSLVYVTSRSLPLPSPCRWATGVSDAQPAQTHMERACETNQCRKKEGNDSGPPCVQHVEGIQAAEERGVKGPSAAGQRQQLEPTWQDVPLQSILRAGVYRTSRGPCWVKWEV